MLALPHFTSGHYVACIVSWVCGGGLVATMGKGVSDGFLNKIGEKIFSRLKGNAGGYVLLPAFNEFRDSTEARLTEHTNTLTNLASTIENSTKETREVLRLFDLKQDSRATDLYDKINTTQVQVAGLNATVEKMPKIVAGELFSLLRQEEKK